MPTSINDAFKTFGIRAEYEGNPAMIVPVTADVAADIDQSKIKQGLNAGDVLISWNDGQSRNGKVLSADARNDLTILVQRNDKTDLRINANSMLDAAVALVNARAAARDDAARVAKANEEGRAAYEAAVERGDRPEAFEAAEPEFADDAFARVAGFVDCVKARAVEVREGRFTDIAMKAKIDGFFANLTKAEAKTLTSEEIARIDEARKLRAEIAALSPGHENAAGYVRPAPYAGTGEAAADVFSELPYDPVGISSAQRSAMAANPNFELVTRLFSVATSTNPMSIQKGAYSHEGFATVMQSLAKLQNKDLTDAIVPRMTAVTKDAMPTYEWEGRMFSKDGADILVMRDEFAAFVYVWDAESTVRDVNVDAALIGRYTAEDVVTDEDLDALRETLAGLRHDNGAEVNFDWDEPEDEDEDLVM